MDMLCQKELVCSSCDVCKMLMIQQKCAQIPPRSPDGSTMTMLEKFLMFASGQGTSPVICVIGYQVA